MGGSALLLLLKNLTAGRHQGRWQYFARAPPEDMLRFPTFLFAGCYEARNILIVKPGFPVEFPTQSFEERSFAALRFPGGIEPSEHLLRSMWMSAGLGSAAESMPQFRPSISFTRPDSTAGGRKDGALSIFVLGNAEQHFQWGFTMSVAIGEMDGPPFGVESAGAPRSLVTQAITSMMPTGSEAMDFLRSISGRCQAPVLAGMAPSITYRSTRGGATGLSFEQAVFEGLAPDGGLMVPETVPDVSKIYKSWSKLKFHELAFEVASLYCSTDEVPAEDLRSLMQRSYKTFDHDEVVPSIKVNDLWVMELFHGPTFAFKDVALQAVSVLA
eukprot:s4541_g3.t1